MLNRMLRIVIIAALIQGNVSAYWFYLGNNTQVPITINADVLGGSYNPVIRNSPVESAINDTSPFPNSVPWPVTIQPGQTAVWAPYAANCTNGIGIGGTVDTVHSFFEASAPDETAKDQLGAVKLWEAYNGDTPYNDLASTTGKSTLDCQIACNNNPACVGYVTDMGAVSAIQKNTGTCWLKSAINPKLIPNPARFTYIKPGNKAPSAPVLNNTLIWYELPGNLSDCAGYTMRMDTDGLKVWQQSNMGSPQFASAGSAGWTPCFSTGETCTNAAGSAYEASFDPVEYGAEAGIRAGMEVLENIVEAFEI